MTAWNDHDAAMLRRFIETNPKFLEELASRVPAIITDQTIEIAAMSGARHAGANNLMKAIKEEMSGVQADVRQTPFIDPSKD